MKAIASNTSRRMLTQIAQRLQLAKTLEASYGADIMTADYKQAPRKAGWSTQQLLTLSAAKALYH